MSNLYAAARRIRYPAVVLSATVLIAGGLAGCGDTTTTERQHSVSESSGPPSRPPGPSLHKVSTNGHELAFYVRSGRSPAIVLDSGGGKDASEWKKVAPLLANKTGSKVITYDRAGEGKSDEVPGPWRAQKAASDLTVGLKKLGVTKNVILVSHSLAGEIAFQSVGNHPRQFSGTVLVDANLPQFFTKGETARLVALHQKQVDALKQKPRTRKTRQLLAQADNYGPVHRAYHKLTWPANVPATAIVSAKTPFPTRTDAGQWRKAQQKFVNAAPNRRLVVAHNSSHDIPADRPDVVVQAVEDMIKQVE